MILDDITKLSKFSHKIIEIRCDFSISDRCRKQWKNRLYAVNIVRDKNNQKDICGPCATCLKQSGSLSHRYKFHKNESFFDEIDSEIKAYLMGWVASDGHIRRNRLTIKIIHSDIKILEYFIKYIMPEGNIKSAKNCKYVDISSKNIQEKLCEHLKISIGPKDWVVRLPSLKSDELMYHYIRGHFEGDGHITKNKPNKKFNRLKISIASVSDEFKKELKEFLDSRNIKSKIEEKNIILHGIEAQKLIEKIYGNCNFYLNRKRDRCLEWDKYKPQTKKMNYQIAEQIRRIYSTCKVSIKELAEIYSVSNSAISNIIYNKSYIGLKQ